MNETLLVRAAGGAWEELQPRTELPDGGVSELLGDDVRVVLGADVPVLVAACSPLLPGGAPDAICVDTTGDVWVLHTELGGNPGDQLLGQLLAFAGGLTGATFDDFAGYCDRRGDASLVDWVAERAGDDFDAGAFEQRVADSLASGRIRLVALVQEASPTLVQSFRYLTSAGALGSIFELSSFGSSSVTAIRSSRVDLVGGGVASNAARVSVSSGARATAEPGPAEQNKPEQVAVAADSAPPRRAATATTTRSAPTKGTVSAGGAAFIEAAAKASSAATATLLDQLQTACSTTFDDVAWPTTDSDQVELQAGLTTPDGITTVVTARVDGSIVLSFEGLGMLDPSWTVRAELCQGMERLLGTDLGDVRQISQLNLSVEEHLMDATLMDALIDLVTDAVGHLHEGAAVAA